MAIRSGVLALAHMIWDQLVLLMYALVTSLILHCTTKASIMNLYDHSLCIPDWFVSDFAFRSVPYFSHTSFHTIAPKRLGIFLPNPERYHEASILDVPCLHRSFVFKNFLPSQSFRLSVSVHHSPPRELPTSSPVLSPSPHLLSYLSPSPSPRNPS